MAQAGLRAPSLLLFFRSDIFASMLLESDEPDKIDHRSFYWNDEDSILEVVNKRIQVSTEEPPGGVLNWNELLDPSFDYDAMRNLIGRSLLYRLRDVIYYYSRVLFHANRRHVGRLMRRDFETALRDYSEYALQVLSAEWSPYIPISRSCSSISGAACRI